MSVIDEPRVADPVDEETGEAERRRRLRRRRQVMVSPLLLVALVLLVPALWAAIVGIGKLTEPDAFADTGAVGGFSGPAEPGSRYTFGLTGGRIPDVTLMSARPLITEGSGPAATTVNVCRTDGIADEIGGIGVVEGDISEFCSQVTPAAGQDLGELGPGDDLILTVVPLTDVPVRVTGIEYRYEQGGRSGTEQVDATLTIGEGP